VTSFAPGGMLKDRYRVVRLLGRGGMASVWLGQDDMLDRPVAVKVLSDAIASDPAFVARFRREAKVAAGLWHPNLVGIYDYAEVDERPYLVMEFVPGEDLGARLARGSQVDCGRLAEELLDAVAHIHGVGILHRDIKPQNIVITPEGGTKLIDFGIALPADATSLTQTGLVLATKRYAAPEVMAGEAATERSDLYSCGIVLRSCLWNYDPRLRSLVARLASRDPRDRPVSAAEALAELGWRAPVGPPTEEFSPTFEHPVVDEPTLPIRTRRSGVSSRRSRVGPAAAIVAVLAAVAVAAVLATGGGEDTGGRGRVAAARQGRGPDRSQAVAPKGEGGSGGEGAQAAPKVEGTPAAAAVEPTGEDPELGAALNQEGFELIQAGRPEDAVPVLEAAVRAFPAGSEDVNYAYALYNLGNALRLSGRAAEAVPVLERRLAIPNQTETVRAELNAARQEAP
jgi:eukaryotic-like serine/threonine-protein kinase